MVSSQQLFTQIKLTHEQKMEGYWIEWSGDLVFVWQHNNQVAMLLATPNIQDKVQDVINRHRVEDKDLARP